MHFQPIFGKAGADVSKRGSGQEQQDRPAVDANQEPDHRSATIKTKTHAKAGLNRREH